jgi:hypothetical protein
MSCQPYTQVTLEVVMRASSIFHRDLVADLESNQSKPHWESSPGHLHESGTSSLTIDQDGTRPYQANNKVNDQVNNKVNNKLILGFQNASNHCTHQ